MKLSKLIESLQDRLSSKKNYIEKSGKTTTDFDCGYEDAVKNEIEFLDELLKIVEEETVVCNCGNINFGFRRRE